MFQKGSINAREMAYRSSTSLPVSASRMTPLDVWAMRAIREGNWKLLMNTDRSLVELYDPGKDPGELDNRASENAPVVERLSKQVLEWNQTLPESPIQPEARWANYPWSKNK